MYPDIFISYKREDAGLVKVIAKELTNYGWIVWWDHNIPAGKDYDAVILDALSNAKSVLVIWSAKSINSRNVKDEANVGLERGVLIPILVGDIKAPIGFRMIQALKWNDNDLVEPEELNDLIYQVKLLIGEPVSGKNILHDEVIRTENEIKHFKETSQKSEPELQTIDEPETHQPAITVDFDEHVKRSSKKSLFIVSAIIALAAFAGIYFYANSNDRKSQQDGLMQTNNEVTPVVPVNNDTSTMLKQTTDSLNDQAVKDSITNAQERQKLAQDSANKVLERQKFIHDSIENLPDMLIRQAVFNLQQYAKDKGIKKVEIKSEPESKPDSVFEFKDASSAIKVSGFLGPLTRSKKISVVIVFKPANQGTGGIIDATQSGRYGFYIGMQQYRPRVDIFYGSDKHAPREDFPNVSKDKWNMVLFTFSYNEINVQVNEKPRQKTDAWGHDILFAGNAQDFIIGGKSIYSGISFTGFIGNLLIYDHCITDEEATKLKELHQAGKLNKIL